MNKRRVYMQKFRVASPKKKRRHLARTLQWLLGIIRRRIESEGCWIIIVIVYVGIQQV